MLLTYFITFFIILYRYPLRINLGMKMKIRKRWGKHVVHENQALVCVQTLRNTQNASSMFASACVLVAFFCFQQAQSLSNAGQTLTAIKFYVLGCDFCAAFIMFGLAIREADSCGYLAFAQIDSSDEGVLDGNISGDKHKSHKSKLNSAANELVISNKNTRGKFHNLLKKIHQN